jgi:hypothetical protein
MDPFLGLGSTVAAAATIGFDFVGIEMDEHYLAGDRARAGRSVMRLTTAARQMSNCTRRRHTSKIRRSKEEFTMSDS